jgi:transcriptional regulator with GAF, ATPase, and Fis domain
MAATQGPLAERMIAAARELQQEPDTDAILEVSTRLAVENVEGCDVAGITLVRKERVIETPAFTHDAARRSDELQLEVGEGPALDSIRDHGVIHSADLAGDSRWRQWGPSVAEETGLRSALCLRLFTTEETVGGLNLYAFERGAFDETAIEDGLAIAAHVAVAVVAVRRVADLNLALESRTAIAAAVGILMERFNLSYERAFAVLSRISSQTNVKIRDLATELLETGTLREQ